MLHERRFFFLDSKAIVFTLSCVYGRSLFTGYLTNVINTTAGAGHSSIAAAGVSAGGTVRAHVSRRAAAAGRLTAGGSSRSPNFPSPTTKNKIAAGGCSTAGGGDSSSAAAGVSAGGTVRAHVARRAAAAG